MIDTYTQAVTTEKRLRRLLWFGSSLRKKDADRNSANGRRTARELMPFLVPFCAYDGMEPLLEVFEEKWRGRRDSNSRPLP